MKRLLPVLGGLLGLALLTFALTGRREPPAASPPRPLRVQVVPAKRAPLTATTVVDGVLQPTARVELTAQVPSRVLRVAVVEGAPVTAGGLVVQLDDAELRGNIARAAAGVAASRALLAKAQAGQVAARQAGQAQRRKAQGGRRAAEAAEAQAKLGVPLTRAQATADLATARAGLQAAQAQAAQAAKGVTLAQTQASADIATAEAGVRAARADLQRAQAGADLAAAAAEADVSRAQAGLAAAQANAQRASDGARVEDLAAARAQVEQARLGRDQAQREVADLEYLLQHGGIAGDTVAGARTQLAITEQQLQSAEAQYAKAAAGATAAERQAAAALVGEAQAGVRAAEVGRGRERVSAGEIAAAQAQLARAEAGLQAARDSRADRLEVAAAATRAAAAQVAQAEAGVAAAEAALTRVAVAQGQAAAAAANTAMARAGESEAAATLAQEQVLAADLLAARAGLQEAEAAQRLAVFQLSRTTLVAPVSGVVTQLAVRPGDTILPGMPVAVIEAAATADLEALATPEQRLQIAVGQPAEVTVPGAPRAFRGTVREVAAVAESDGRSFKVRIVVQHPDLPPGLHASAAIAVSSAPAALQIPAAAVLDSADGGAVVYLHQEGRARRQVVTLGLRTPQAVEVLDGLSAGAPVVVAEGTALYDGAPLEVD